MTEPQQVYRDELFVNHDSEIELVEDAVSAAVEREAERKRAVTFYGERGSGKTWLMRRLGNLLPKDFVDKNVEVLSLFLAPPPVEPVPAPDEPRWFAVESESTMAEAVVLEAVKWVCRRWAILHDPNAGLDELTYWLGRDLPRKTDRTYVLLVDSVFEVNRDWLPRFEDHLLAPIASLENGLVVMTGRGAPFPWRSVPLRNDHCERVLAPFSEHAVADQLHSNHLNDDPARVALIRKLGGGYPLNSYILAQADPPSLALDKLIRVLLEFVQRPQQSQASEALISLCVLERFREREISSMLTFYRICFEPSEPAPKFAAEDARRVRDVLLENALVRWEIDGYTINASVQIAFRSYLCYRNISLFEYLIDRAEAMYLEWADKYENAREHYRRQAALVCALRSELVDSALRSVSS